MIYYLYSFLEINLFQYITFRAAIAFFVAFFLTIFIMPYYIVWARKKNANQPISQFTPQNHKQKVNIPTMGGIIFVFATLVASILCAKLDNAFVIFGLMSLVLFSSIGIYDDYSKVLQRKNAGMSAKMKFTLQAISGFLVSLGLYCYGMDSHFYLPFFKNFIWDWGLFSLLFWTLVFVATSNAVNLTDGLDGLATIPSIYALTSLGIFVYIAGHSVFSTYLLYPKIPDSGEVVVVSAALIGALIGFLWYNCHPAQVFMGVTNGRIA